MSIKDEIQAFNPNNHNGSSFEARVNFEVNEYISKLLSDVKIHYTKSNRWTESFERHLPTIIYHSNCQYDNSPFFRPSLGNIALVHDEYRVNSKEEAKFLSTALVDSLKKEGFTSKVYEESNYGKTKQGFLKYKNWESFQIDIVVEMAL